MELTWKVMKLWQLLVLNVDRKKEFPEKDRRFIERIREILVLSKKFMISN